MENTTITAQEFINTLDNPVVFYNNIFNNSHELAVWHDYEFPFSFDDIEGEVDSEGVWNWNGESDERDDSNNSIVRIQISNNQEFFETDIINYALFSDCEPTSISDVTEDFIKEQAAYCCVSENRIAKELSENLNIESAKEDADGDTDKLEEIQRAEKAIAKFLV